MTTANRWLPTSVLSVLHSKVWINGMLFPLIKLPDIVAQGEITTMVTDANNTYAQNIYIRPKRYTYSILITDMDAVAFIEAYTIYKIFSTLVLKRPFLPNIVTDFVELFKVGDNATLTQRIQNYFNTYFFLLDKLTIEYQAVKQLIFDQIIPANILRELLFAMMYDQRGQAVRTIIFTFTTGLVHGYIDRHPVKAINPIGNMYEADLSFSEVILSQLALTEENYTDRTGKPIPIKSATTVGGIPSKALISASPTPLIMV